MNANDYFFSASTIGFYRLEIHAEKIPADAVKITEQQHEELLDGQSKGKQITSNESGQPMLIDPPIVETTNQQSSKAA